MFPMTIQYVYHTVCSPNIRCRTGNGSTQKRPAENCIFMEWTFRSPEEDKFPSLEYHLFPYPWHNNCSPVNMIGLIHSLRSPETFKPNDLREWAEKSQSITKNNIVNLMNNSLMYKIIIQKFSIDCSKEMLFEKKFLHT